MKSNKINFFFLFYFQKRNLSSENMQFLNVDQALADIAYFVKIKKSGKISENTKVIVFGGSYSGNMAAWIRIKYPHLFQVSIKILKHIYSGYVQLYFNMETLKI